MYWVDRTDIMLSYLLRKKIKIKKKLITFFNKSLFSFRLYETEL